jgi:DNA-binding transcriptional ArsR family regulator
MAHLHQDLLRGLRASAEASRLRLLAILSAGEFTVSELTEILGQSQPSVSRHLKLLSDGGLLERFRELHWVYYRLPSDGDGAELARALLELLDRDDPALALDRSRAAAVLAARVSGVTEEHPPEDGGAERELAEAAAAQLAAPGLESLLYFGDAPTGMLQALGPRARKVVGVSGSRSEVQRARAGLRSRGLAHCLVQHGDLKVVNGGGNGFDAVVLDRVLAGHSRPDDLLRDASRLLDHDGQLLLVEDYDGLENRAGAGNPLAMLRDWITQSGLLCARLRPVDAGGAHRLLAVAAADPVHSTT